MKLLSLIALIFILSDCHTLSAQNIVETSGGELLYEQAAYDVTHYDLQLRVDPDAKSIAGTLRMEAEVLLPTDRVVLDLDPRFTVESIRQRIGEDNLDRHFSKQADSKRLFIHLPQTVQPGDIIDLTVAYHGRPREATNPPWEGGFVWSRTPSGDPWIGVACQSDGAWIWWPNKDHPSDKADSVSMTYTLPEGLVVAANGRLEGTSVPEPGWISWHWSVSTPINNYNVTLNAAPYEVLSDEYQSVTGEMMELTFWVLPEYLEQGRTLFPQFSEHLRFFEELLGPYPFRADKYGVAHTPYLGMEHQTIIAYGANFRNGALHGPAVSFDDLHHHELAHEWWGNMVTAWDWKDFWIHEGMGTYMQALYEEKLNGREAYQELMERIRVNIRLHYPVAPRESRSTAQMDAVGNDVYYKGAWFLHTLRYYLGDELFFESLRLFAYPDPEMEQITDGRQVRFATTDDYLELVNRLSGEDLKWIFDAYLRETRLPELRISREDDSLALTWNTPGGRPFNMPLEIEINGERQRVTPVGGGVSLQVPESAAVNVDPDHRVLKSIAR